MPLTLGTRLGAYEVIAKLGEGGMGEVYRATDTTLGRQVAIKILPDAFASDPERLARFEREAKTLASLNHPHIAAIYGFEKSAGLHALVMELVDGEDLSQRIARGAIPLDEALPIAKQIAEALEAAHEQGIIHRDLKPANIKVRADGAVKVLDFGLAKAMDVGSGGPGGLSMSPTLSMHATQAGIILGTAAYMAPEQARAKTVDKRADIWAFGVVVYEMLTGQRAFKGDDVSETLASVLKDTPSLEALPPATPPRIRELIHDCLQRDPKQRLRDIGDARLVLDRIIAGAPDGALTTSAAAPTSSRSAWWRALPWAAAAVTSSVAVALWFSALPATTSHSMAVRRLVLPITETLVGGAGFAWSPDGTRLVYVAREGNEGDTPRLFVRAVDEAVSRPIPGTDGASQPTFSPDSRSILFRTATPPNIMRLQLDGGLPVLVTKPPGPQYGQTWAKDQTVLFAAPGTAGMGLGSLWRAPLAGGDAVLVAEPDPTRRERGYNSPEILPDGSILFLVRGNDSRAVAVLPHGRPPAKILIEGARQPHYLPSGYLLFARLATVMAAPFDLEHLTLKGAPVPVQDGVLYGGDTFSAFRLSDDGTLVYLAGAARPLARQAASLADRRTGRETTLPFTADAYGAARFAPDKAVVALGVQRQDGEKITHAIWLADLTRNTLTPFVADGSRFAWTPDGKRIVFQKSDGALAWRMWDLSGGETTIASDAQIGGMIEGQPSWSPDGRGLAFASVRAHERGSDVWIARGLTGNGAAANGPAAEGLVSEPGNQSQPAFSPDGRWLAYQAGVPGPGIYVRPFPGPGSVSQIAAGGGAFRWVGRELFFVQGRQIMAVTITTSPSLEIGTPQPVLTLPDGATFADVRADGQQFLLLKTVSDPPDPLPHEFHVVINFVEEMKRKVAAGQ